MPTHPKLPTRRGSGPPSKAPRALASKDKAGNSDFARVPKVLLALNCVGMHPKTKARFCYNWNLKKCEHGGKAQYVTAIARTMLPWIAPRESSRD